ncbi:MAG TPA: 2Fe-2S iron-sulfur cluster binding domain-containing protein [Pyrinomonadaceae bacterium]|nr:2Fe-2S iron-sulfur cluster binding domain-containing protein [Pyrinomonadaceae bacterium]
MSVNIEFEPSGIHGVVAEGTYLWDAAKRMGVRLPAECAGRGECDTCAVSVPEGATLLSSLTNAERERLSPERLAAGERLACQAKAVRPGTVRLRPVPVEARETETAEEATQDLRAEFRRLPLQQQLTTLVELEAAAAYKTFKTIGDVMTAALAKGADVIVGAGRARARRQRESHRPTEHRAAKGDGGKSPS